MTTPYYLYDTKLLRKTLDAINKGASTIENSFVHYAVKACTNPKVLEVIRDAGLGIDCVSGGEIEAVVKAGFDPARIMFAGVGKADWEIQLALDYGIECFVAESIPELEVINEFAAKSNKIADVCLRINPNVGAHTHANIVTGLSENKFGINMADMMDVIKLCDELSQINFRGLHFHIGSQILEMDDFEALCRRINELQDKLDEAGIHADIIDVGGGLGIDYENPEKNPIPDFDRYFDVFRNHLKLRKGQELHFELGRAVVGQCGRLITKVLFVKSSGPKQFAIVDAGFTDLIRPALYDAHHKIVNISNTDDEYETYDVVGPICESSDVFDKDVRLKKTKRGDLLAILSAGAYGEIMASQYNCRRLPKGYTEEELAD